MTSREKAYELIRHYAIALEMDQQEVELLVDYVIDAVKEELKPELDDIRDSLRRAFEGIGP